MTVKSDWYSNSSPMIWTMWIILQVRANDLRLYEESTDPNGPAMTHAMFAIGWLELGETEKAKTPFRKNYDNIQGPFKV